MGLKDKAERRKSKPRKKVPKRITESYLTNAGTAYLERFPASTAHFRQIMVRKIDRSCRTHTEQDRDACLSMLENVIQKFQTLGFLDDAAYLKGMVTSCRRRGMATRIIIQKLAQKGLPPDAVHAMIQSYDSENLSDTHGTEHPSCGDLIAALRLAARKKMGPFATEEKLPLPYDKALARLARAGFSFDIAKKILDMSRDEAEEILHPRL